MAMKLTAATNDNDGLETLVDLQVFLSLLAPNKLDYLGIAENIFSFFFAPHLPSLSRQFFSYLDSGFLRPQDEIVPMFVVCARDVNQASLRVLLLSSICL